MRVLMLSRRTWPLLIVPALLVAGVLVAGVASPAAAATTVPGEVAAYISTRLIDDLNDFYGPGTEGNGRLFTNTTTTSPGTRVFEFTPDFVAGIATDPPVRRVNEWVSVISIDKAPVGFALVIVDPITTLPHLESFTESADFGEVVLALPETARLVRDNARSAWFTLDEEELTPIVSGATGVTEPISVDAYRELVADELAAAADAEPEPANQYGGLLIAGLILVLIILLLAVEVFRPHWRWRSRARHGAESLESEVVPEVAAPAEAGAEPEAVSARVAKPRSKSKPEVEPEPNAAVSEPAVSEPRAPRTKPKASS